MRLADSPILRNFTAARLQSFGGVPEQQKTHIEGLQITWVSVSAISIGTGSAYIPSLNKVIEVSATINLTGLTGLTINTWYYVYLKSDATAEVSITAPASPYCGSARAKSADTTRRFIGALRTDSGGNIRRFDVNLSNGLWRWVAIQPSATPFRVKSAGTDETSTAVSCAAVVPPQSRLVYLSALSLVTGVTAYVGSNDYTVSATSAELVAANFSAFGSPTITYSVVGCDASQNIAYMNNAPSGETYIDVCGFYLSR